MKTYLDRLELSKHPVFQDLKDNVSKSSSNISLIEVREGILYVWNDKESALGAVNLQVHQNSSNEHHVQNLIPSNPPIFQVTGILINLTTTQCALIGPSGLSIMEIPRRFGYHGSFERSKRNITCRCSVIDERYFNCHSKRIIRQVRWHPGSPEDNHILVLTTDNYLRLYSTDDVSLISVWPLFRSSNITMVSSLDERLVHKERTILTSLGDTGVDFDFCPPNLVRDDKSEDAEIQWPILILFGNGDVFIAIASILNRRSSLNLIGPLKVTPPMDDISGMEDASSLLVLQSTPPVVVIAASNGVIYHSMLLNSEEPLKNDDDEEMIRTDNRTLHIIECVELQLGLSLEDTVELYASPILLHKDPTVRSRYFCSHEAGLHVVMMPLIAELNTFAKCPEEEINISLPSFSHARSSVEYLICTKVISEGISGSPTTLLGITITDDLPAILIVLLSSGEVISFPIRSIVYQSENMMESTKASSQNEPSNKKMEEESFERRIYNMLKETGQSRPLFRLNSNKVTLQACLELLTQQTHLYREEYFPKYEKVLKEIERRVRILDTMKVSQFEKLQALKREKTELRSRAEELAMKYEDISEKQEELSNRCGKLLTTISQRTSIGKSDERMKDKIVEYQEKVGELKSSIETVRKKKDYQKKMEEKYKIEPSETAHGNLTTVQESTIKDYLADMTERIAKLELRIKGIQQSLAITNDL